MQFSCRSQSGMDPAAAKDAYKKLDGILKRCPTRELLRQPNVDLSTLSVVPYGRFDPESTLQSLVSTADPRAVTPRVRSIALAPIFRWGSQDNVRTIFGFSECPGLVYIPGFFSDEDQAVLANECLRELTKPPSQTNLSRLAGGRHNFEPRRNVIWPEQRLCAFRALRWVTLGHQYNWTTRTYDQTLPFPTPLQRLAVDIARRTIEALHRRNESKKKHGRSDDDDDVVANAIISTLNIVVDGFKPDAAILNFYREKDRLGGHTDEVETAEYPLVSISLGMPALFVVGSLPQPVAWVLRSGDVVLLTGAARYSLHGVPRLVRGGLTSSHTTVPLNFDHFLLSPPPLYSLFYGSDQTYLEELLRDFDLLYQTLRTCRINLSIRQVA